MMLDTQPFTQLQRLHDEMLRRFDAREGEGKTTATWAPPVDVLDDGEKLTFEVDVPGVDKDSIALKFDKRVLTIEGQRKREVGPKTEFVRMERASGPFHRSFRLPETVDADAITAELKDGVLRLTLPQKKEALPRKIDIR